MSAPIPDQATRDPLWDVVRLVMTVAGILFGVWAYTVASDFKPRAAYFPVAAAGIVILFGLLQFTQDVRNYVSGRPVVIPGLDVESPIFGLGTRGLIPALRNITWFVAYAGLLYVTGVLVASFIFLLLFSLIEARWRLGGSIALASGVTLATAVIIRVLELRAPRSLLDIGHSLLQ
jgi:hypothetical protein